jgi:hypothetical protein
MIAFQFMLLIGCAHLGACAESRWGTGIPARMLESRVNGWRQEPDSIEISDVDDNGTDEDDSEAPANISPPYLGPPCGLMVAAEDLESLPLPWAMCLRAPA